MRKKLQPRDILVKEGDAGENVYIVLKGELQIQKKEGTKLQSYGFLGPRSIIGEEALLSKMPYAYTLRATEPVEVLEITPENLQEAFDKLPVWFPPLLRFMDRHARKLEHNRKKLAKIYALPALLFLCAKYAQKSEDGTFPLAPLIEDLGVIHGLGHNDAFELLRALCDLGTAKLIPGDLPQIHFYRKNLPALLYRTLLARKKSKNIPRSLLSANDQTILTVFASVAKTKGQEKQGTTFIHQKDFVAKYKELFPGVKLTHRAFENLVQCGYLFSVPEFLSTPNFKDISQFYADKEAVKDLLELNRVYPLLDKKLIESMESR